MYFCTSKLHTWLRSLSFSDFLFYLLNPSDIAAILLCGHLPCRYGKACCDTYVSFVYVSLGRLWFGDLKGPTGSVRLLWMWASGTLSLLCKRITEVHRRHIKTWCAYLPFLSIYLPLLTLPRPTSRPKEIDSSSCLGSHY